MALPKSAKDTGRYVLNMKAFTDDTIPNCDRCFIIGSHHAKTKEIGYFAFCKRSGTLEKVGPYETFHKALKTLTLTKGCDSCSFNKSEDKSSFLPLLDKRIEEEMKEMFGEDHILSVITGPLQSFVENRKYVDLNFKDQFGTRLFKTLPDDSVAIVDLCKPCQSEKDFAAKIQALAGVIGRINENQIRNLIKDKKSHLKGSINILEQIMNENFPHYPKHIISNLRNLMALRSKMYPAHATSSDILVILRNFGIDEYPLIDWEKGWRKILSLCAESLRGLIEIMQTKRIKGKV